MIRALIVEDEELDSSQLMLRLERNFKELNVLASCDNVIEAITLVHKLKPDLIFLDVELPPHTGFNLLEETRGLNYHTIFTTSFNHYAVQAFKYSAVHYLQKPYNLDDLKEAIAFFKTRVKYEESTGEIGKVDVGGKDAEDAILHNLKSTQENQIIGFPLLGGRQFIPIKDVIWCQANDVYTDVHLTDKRKITVTLTLKKVELLLRSHNFFRVHKSYLINLDHMRKYMRGEGGIVVMSDGFDVDVSRSKKEPFIDELKRRNIY